MDTDVQLIYMGILVGWLISIISIATVGLIAGIHEIEIVVMIGFSAGILVLIYLIASTITFFQRFKIVRRD